MSTFLQLIKNYHYFFAFLLYTFAAVYITFPLIFNLGSLAPDVVDSVLIAYIQNWGINSLFSGNITGLFNASIYYPFANTLAFSYIHFSSGILASPLLLFIKEPIAIYNFTLWSSIILLGFSLYCFSFYLTKNILAALLSGTLIIFSPAVLSTYIHIHLLGMQWFIFSLFFFYVFLDRQKTKFLVISLLFFIFQMYNSFLPAYFILFSCIILCGFYYLYKKKTLKKVINKKNAFIIFIAFLLTVPVVTAYYQATRDAGVSRQITEAIHLSMQPEDLLFSSSYTKLHTFLNNLPFNRVSQNNEFQPGYPGLIFLGLIVIALIFCFRQFKKKQITLNFLLTTGLFGLVLSLGPVLHLGRHTIHHPFPIPLPYTLFYFLFPGFQGIRNAASWELLFLLMFALLIAIMLHLSLKKLSKIKKMILYLILFVGVLWEFNPVMGLGFASIPQTKDFPKVYAWLATTPNDTRIVEMPVYTWRMHPYVFDENMREYYATMHFRKMINGASGFSPESWQRMVADLLKSFPSEESLNKLRAMKIDYIIVHKSEYDRLARDKFVWESKQLPPGDVVIKSLTDEYNIKIIKRFGDDYVFEL